MTTKASTYHSIMYPEEIIVGMLKQLLNKARSQLQDIKSPFQDEGVYCFEGSSLNYDMIQASYINFKMLLHTHTVYQVIRHGSMDRYL